MPRDERPTVWSSSGGDQRKQQTPQPIPTRSRPPSQQVVYLHRDSKGRGGKTVSLVKNLVLSPKDMQALAKQLKQACGSGGTIKDEVIEIQGEHRQKIAEVLQKLGYQVKIAGG
ncbi:MAG: translation initiation factor [Anaerolineales bacterium]|nr:translation initiation factor [Anaerolineales bacterium]